jgi:23S rRNA (uracil1939-C5)-methyltransferase
VLLQGGFPGERVEVEVTESQARLVRGRVVRVVESERLRELSACAVSDRCGGCRFWGVTAEDELRWKVSSVRDAVARIDRQAAWPEPQVIAASRRDGYRLRARFHLLQNGASGFYEPGSDRVVRSEACLAVMPELDRARVRIAASAQELPPGTGIFVEWDDALHAVAAIIEVPGYAFDRAKAWAKRAAAELLEAGIHTLRVDRVADEGRAGVGRVARESFVAWGSGQVAVMLDAGSHQLRVDLPLGGFRQGNREMSSRLRDLVLEPLAGRTGRAMDLFAGYGNFAFGLGAMGWDVDAVELTGGGFEAGKAVASKLRAQGVMQVRFASHDLRRGLPDAMLSRQGEYRVAVLDPPRGGLSRELVEHLGVGSLERIGYVSCDPPALARDVAALRGHGFALASWTLVDLFPRTPHIEAIALLTRPPRSRPKPRRTARG